MAAPNRVPPKPAAPSVPEEDMAKDDGTVKREFIVDGKKYNAKVYLTNSGQYILAEDILDTVEVENSKRPLHIQVAAAGTVFQNR